MKFQSTKEIAYIYFLMDLPINLVETEGKNTKQNNLKIFLFLSTRKKKPFNNNLFKKSLIDGKVKTNK